MWAQVRRPQLVRPRKRHGTQFSLLFCGGLSPPVPDRGTAWGGLETAKLLRMKPHNSDWDVKALWVFWLGPQHVEIPGPETEPEPQQCQLWILNRLSHQGILNQLFLMKITHVAPGLAEVQVLYISAQKEFGKRQRDG